MRLILVVLLALAGFSVPVAAQNAPVQALLQEFGAQVAKPSRKTIQPVIDAIAGSGLAEMPRVLEAWGERELWRRKSDELFFRGIEEEDRTLRIFDLDTDAELGVFPRGDFKQAKPNSGVQALISTALVRFQLSDPDPARRAEALLAIQRGAQAAHLGPLRASIEGETDNELRALKERLAGLLTITYDTDTNARLSAIEMVSTDLGVDVRAALNPLVATTRDAVVGSEPGPGNIAAIIEPGSDMSAEDAYDFLAEKGLVPARISDGEIHAALAANIEEGRVGGVPLAQLSDPTSRLTAYDGLADANLVPPRVRPGDIELALSSHTIFDTYSDSDPLVTDAAQKALSSIETRVGFNQALDLSLDALSLASIYFLAAIGLAITFGVMGVINMAHGEFIMMGAYTGYVVQQFVPDYTLSIIIALPLAFAVTFGAGVAMERLVIRWLYHRPLETLLATFGISIALQQLAKNIFGTQARPLTSPGWLDGAWVLNDVVSISYIRIAIFVLALMFLGLFLFIMKRTRLGLETRAVTQNPRMAGAMGINPDRVNMLTFGLGSGIAGVAGVAIGLFAKVTSELGSDYIVQSFMTVVVGGVGNIWGALAGAAMIGFLQKGIEWFNPSNTLAAQTYMIIFIIIFIQFRPRGIIALKGRAAGD